MKKLSEAKKKENRINDLLTDCYTLDQFLDQFEYLTSKNRFGGRTTRKTLANRFNNRDVASLIKKLDPQAYSQM